MTAPPPGRYVVLEGPDGGGKSTQARRLAATLTDEGRSVLHLREPGSTPLGERLRTLLLDPAAGELSALAEALLFFAARVEMLERQVRPALASGALVLVERCYLSTWVYQGVASATPVPIERLRELTAWVHAADLPDRVFLLDVGADVARRRRGGTEPDRIEARGDDHHERVRRGYLALARDDTRIEVVDASAPPDAVERVLLQRVRALLEPVA